MKLIDFSVATGAISEDAEHRRKISFSVALEDTKRGGSCDVIANLWYLKAY